MRAIRWKNGRPTWLLCSLSDGASILGGDLIGISNQDKSVKSTYEARNDSYDGRFGNVCTLVDNYGLKIGPFEHGREDGIPNGTEYGARDF